MTATQRDGVMLAVQHAIARVVSKDDLARTAISLARLVVADALHSYPVDRSCHTCDFYVDDGTGAHFCSSWQSEIPKTHVEQGCSRHQVHGAPF